MMKEVRATNDGEIIMNNDLMEQIVKVELLSEEVRENEKNAHIMEPGCKTGMHLIMAKLELYPSLVEAFKNHRTANIFVSEENERYRSSMSEVSSLIQGVIYALEPGMARLFLQNAQNKLLETLAGK